MQEIKSLTALRGIFAMWVLCLHLSTSLPSGVVVLPIVSRGYLAVDFFFVLSGFILSRVHGQTFATNWNIGDYARFAGKRFWRLFPLHWVALLITVIKLASLGKPTPPLQCLGGEFLLIHRWNLWPATPNATNAPDWSISTEWAASLLFPLFAAIGLRGRRAAAAMAVGSVSTLAMIAWRHNGTIDVSLAPSWFPLARCFAEFGLGVVHSRTATPGWLSRDATIITLAATLLVFVTLKIDLAALAALVLLLAALAPERSAASRFLSQRPLHWLGTVSYSIYLIQMPVIQAVRRLAIAVHGPTTVLFVVGSIGAVLVVSHFTHAFIEARVPLLVRKLFPPPAPATPYADLGL